MAYPSGTTTVIILALCELLANLRLPQVLSQQLSAACATIYSHEE